MPTLNARPPFLLPADIERKADEIRGQADWEGIPVDPFAIATRLGIDVLLGSFQDDSVEGVLRTQEGRPQILVRVASRLDRQKFTVAHELGHFVLHWPNVPEPREDQENFVDDDLLLYRRGSDQTSLSQSDRDKEVQANMFAAALLMPASAVTAHSRTSRSARVLAKQFGVSELAMRYRINELDVW